MQLLIILKEDEKITPLSTNPLGIMPPVLYGPGPRCRRMPASWHSNDYLANLARKMGG